MMQIGCFSRLPNRRPSPARIKRMVEGMGTAILAMATGVAVAQNPASGLPSSPSVTQKSVPEGYSIHESFDLG